ncbi:hypothetical protein [Novosphingobium lentum]|uniref:hypothetical protein n=1 Tax=Novosphingobium lentum TaxID=145287 RepID=UPI000832D712|nr:hypothetical protein [Novosphingobium lentum]
MTKALAATMVIGVVSAPAYGAAGDMSVAAFMAKAAALNAKGPMALFSGDYSLLKAEAAGGAQAYRAQLRGELAAGHPSSCPPPRAPFTSDDILGQMRSYPVAVRDHTSVRAAITELFRKTYPCPAARR